MKGALEITKELALCFTLIQCFSKSCKFTCIQRHLARVYKGHLQNKVVRKPKSSKLSALSPVFSACIIYTVFIEIPRYNLKIPRTDFCETLHSRRHLSKEYIA